MAYRIVGYFRGWNFWKRPPELNFVVLNFMARGATGSRMMYVNFELGVRGENFDFDEKR